MTRDLRALAAGVVIGLAGLTAAPALAQDDGTQLTPPKPRNPDQPPMLATYFFLAVVVAVGVGVNFIPSKRGHQD